MSYRKCVFLLIVIFCLVGCGTDVDQLQSSSVPGILVDPEPQKIVSGQDIQDIWWSSDSEKVYWRWGTYNLEENTRGVLSLSEREDLLQTPTPRLPDRFPQHYLAYPSPSGNRALYFSLVDAPVTPTFDPAIEGGETSDACGTSELLMWKVNETISLGHIEHCRPNRHLWTPDEQRVVLIQDEVVPPSRRAWVIDVPGQIIYPIARNQSGLLQIHDISPDGQYILYSYYLDNTGENRLFLMDLESLDSFSLEGSVHRVSGWLSPKTILVWCYGGELSASHPLGILDLNTSRCTELMDESSNMTVGYASISPDKQWIAFTIGETIHTQESVWLMKRKFAE